MNIGFLVGFKRIKLYYFNHIKSRIYEGLQHREYTQHCPFRACR